MNRRLEIDEARLLPHLRKQPAATFYVAPDAQHVQIQTLVLAHPGGDPRALRGIPVIARSVGGTSPGTHPEAETIRRSEPRRRNAA